MLFTFFRFWPETPFLGKFGPNWQYLQFFLFPMRNAFFWKNLVQNVKIVSLKLNLLASLMRICRIQRRCSLFLFSIGNVFFGANVVQNFKIVGLNVNFSSQCNSNIQNSLMLFTFLFSTGNTIYGQIWAKKLK